MNYLVKALYKGTKLVLVGDIDQLPSVGPGSVLKDLIESNKLPYITLNKIFRQALQSKIIVNSHKVNEGINFITEKESQGEDFCFIEERNNLEILKKIVELYNSETQLITPSKKRRFRYKKLK